MQKSNLKMKIQNVKIKLFNTLSCLTPGVKHTNKKF